MDIIDNEDVQLIDRIGILHKKNNKEQFIISDEWKICTRELLRNLRREKTQNLNYSRKLGFMKVLENKLIPLSISYENDSDIQSEVAKLIYNLTLPPENDLESIYYQELYRYQRSYLNCIIEKKYISVLMSIMSEALIPNENNIYDYNDIKTIDLILHIFRNLLLIPDESNENSIKLYNNVLLFYYSYMKN